MRRNLQQINHMRLILLLILLEIRSLVRIELVFGT